MMLEAHSPADTLSAWLDDLESRHAQPIQLGLERVRACALQLGVASKSAAVIITVAGTNGKGSTVAALEAIYCSAGFRVASYTSPHLLVFNERIRIHQMLVSDEVICAAFRTLQACPLSQALTYFERVTLAALLIFKAHALDVILLEVGMGGRLDATNFMDADLSIITTVDFDHQQWLGDTRDAIGYEKAGILRANKPAIYADLHCPDSVITYARENDVPLICLGKDYFIHVTANDTFELQGPLKENLFSLTRPRLNLKAAAAALVATQQLQHVLPVEPLHYVHAMQKVFIQGRQQCLGGRIKTVLDVAHNPQAVALLANFILEQAPSGCVHAVFSGLKDKDLCGLIEPMKQVVDVWYPTLLKGARASSEQLLRAAFSSTKTVFTHCFHDPVAAFQAAMGVAQPGDWVVVYGSFLTVGAVIEADLILEE